MQALVCDEKKKCVLCVGSGFFTVGGEKWLFERENVNHKCNHKLKKSCYVKGGVRWSAIFCYFGVVSHICGNYVEIHEQGQRGNAVEVDEQIPNDERHNRVTIRISSMASGPPDTYCFIKPYRVRCP